MNDTPQDVPASDAGWVDAFLNGTEDWHDDVDRCPSSFVGLQCALPAGHSGAHRNKPIPSDD